MSDLESRSSELLQHYGTSFYDGQRSDSAASAARVVPLVVSLVQPRSVVDVGCGVGTWAAAFLQSGALKVLGVDGPHVSDMMLQIPKNCFASRDLTEPLAIDGTWDLAVCLEVAEHLPPERACSLVHDLVKLAPCVLFSAAIPGQGGTFHINEQFMSYWAEKFEAHGYFPVDLLRPAIWQNPDVCWWYRQNMMLFVSREHALFARRTCGVLDVVHPELFNRYRSYGRPSAPASLGLRSLLKQLPFAIRAAGMKRLGRQRPS